MRSSSPAPARGRRWGRWVLGGVAAALIVFVGGPFLYIHVIEGKAAAPLSLATQTTTPTTGAGNVASSSTGASVDGSWKVASGSVAGYRIKETLFGQSNTAVGRTSAITGSFTISGTSVTTGSFTADLTKVTSDQSQRDDQFQNRIMDTSQFPTATFALTQPIRIGTLPATGVQLSASATGTLMLHGVTKSVTFTVQAERAGTTIKVSGSIPVTFADYGISNPSGGPASTASNGIMEFLLVFSHA